MKWQDTTSYSQAETDRTPRVWTARAGCFAIKVHRHIHYEPDAWLLSCDGIVEMRELSSTDIGDAKREAIGNADRREVYHVLAAEMRHAVTNRV